MSFLSHLQFWRDSYFRYFFSAKLQFPSPVMANTTLCWRELIQFELIQTDEGTYPVCVKDLLLYTLVYHKEIDETVFSLPSNENDMFNVL